MKSSAKRSQPEATLFVLEALARGAIFLIKLPICIVWGIYSGILDMILKDTKGKQFIRVMIILLSVALLVQLAPQALQQWIGMAQTYLADSGMLVLQAMIVFIGISTILGFGLPRKKHKKGKR